MNRHISRPQRNFEWKYIEFSDSWSLFIYKHMKGSHSQTGMCCKWRCANLVNINENKKYQSDKYGKFKIMHLRKQGELNHIKVFQTALMCKKNLNKTNTNACNIKKKINIYNFRPFLYTRKQEFP